MVKISVFIWYLRCLRELYGLYKLQKLRELHKFSLFLCFLVPSGVKMLGRVGRSNLSIFSADFCPTKHI